MYLNKEDLKRKFQMTDEEKLNMEKRECKLCLHLKSGYLKDCNEIAIDSGKPDFLFRSIFGEV